jgi:hypothetical protein
LGTEPNGCQSNRAFGDVAALVDNRILFASEDEVPVESCIPELIVRAFEIGRVCQVELASSPVVEDRSGKPERLSYFANQLFANKVGYETPNNAPNTHASPCGFDRVIPTHLALSDHRPPRFPG